METKKFIDHHPGSKAVLDIEGRLMFVVDDAKKWHKDNILLNADEYYKNNVLGKIKDILYRRDDLTEYGVISFKNLSRALIHWDNLAVSSSFLKEPSSIYYPDSSWDTGAHVIDTYLLHNREYAVLTSLLASDIDSIEELLCSVFSYSTKDLNEAKEYVKKNYDRLVNLFQLDFDHEWYYVQGDSIKFFYDILVKYYKMLLPTSLLKFFDEKSINIANRKEVLLATKDYLERKKRKDKNLLNSSYNEGFIRNSSFTLK